MSVIHPITIRGIEIPSNVFSLRLIRVVLLTALFRTNTLIFLLTMQVVKLVSVMLAM